ADVLIRGLTVRDGLTSSGHGINCSDSGGPPTVRVRDATIGPNPGVGIRSTGCTIEIVSSTLSGNTGGGLSANGGSVELVSSSLLGNTGGGVSAPGGSVEIVSSSLLGNTAGGLSLQDSSFVVLNSLIPKNGGVTGFFGGAALAGCTESPDGHHHGFGHVVRGGAA